MTGLRILAFCCACMLPACSGDSAAPDPALPPGGTAVPAAMHIVSGNGQAAQPQQRLAEGLVVSVTDAAGVGLSGIAVSWSVVAGQGLVSAASSTSDAAGRTSVTYTAGSTPGTDSVRAAIGSIGVTFSATVSAPPVALGADVQSLSAGADFTCGIGAQGQAYCWGQDTPFRLGDGFHSDARYPVTVTGGLTLVALDAGTGHACGVTLSGAAVCWGGNQTGQLGTGFATTQDVPAPVVELPPVRTITAGAAHTCALDLADRAWCWGYNASGELGDGTSGNVFSTPRQVAGGHRFAQISAGDFATCGVTDAGTGLCWGSNDDGQLGDGTTTARPRPDTIAGPHAFRSVQVGYDHACGLTTQGRVFCWGANDYGQLGDGTSTSRTLPVAVSTEMAFTRISAGFLRTCAIATSGGLHCWGLQPGSTSASDATPTAVVTPQPVAAVTIGRHHTCFVTNGGDTYCHGDNSHGELGDGTRLTRTAPVLVLGRIRYATSPIRQSLVVPPFRVRDVGLSLWLSCAVREDGAVACWGDGGFGQLGNGMSRNSTVPITLPLPAPALIVDAGEIYACALVQSGAAYCWGDSRYGRLGRGSLLGSSTPAPVAGQLTFTQVGTGARHACGLTAAGEAYCWGNNSFGQLGIATTGGPGNCTSYVCSSVPVRVSGGVAFRTLSVGSYHNCAISLSDVLYCWGSNVGGELGVGSKVGPATCQAFSSSGPGACSTSPIPIGGSLTFRAVAAAKGSHTCAIAVNGDAWCWGPNGSGRLGDGTTTERLSPTRVTGGFTWSRIYAGDAFSCGITTQQAAYCWGGLSGQRLLGNAAVDLSPVPVPVSGGPAFIELTLGVNHACGTTASAELHCWGSNNVGQLGDPRTPFGGYRNVVPVWGLGLPDLR